MQNISSLTNDNQHNFCGGALKVEA